MNWLCIQLYYILINNCRQEPSKIQYYWLGILGQWITYLNKDNNPRWGARNVPFETLRPAWPNTEQRKYMVYIMSVYKSTLYKAKYVISSIKLGNYINYHL